MARSHLVVGLSAMALSVASAAKVDDISKAVFLAKLTPIGSSNVTGRVMVYAATDTQVIYTGSAYGLEANLEAADCTATNGCGSHIHSGSSCETTELQGGHYYAGSVTTDPWLTDGYLSDASGSGTFGGPVTIGETDSLEGRAFIVHAADGSRVSCGLLQPISGLLGGLETLTAETKPLSNSGVMGRALLVTDVEREGEICFFGNASGLEPNLQSVHVGGSDCTATNGCGAHVHSGKSCADGTAQGGHYWNETMDSATMAAASVDPWLPVGYHLTTADGKGWFGDCVKTGIVDPEYIGRAFIVHANDGSRVSCGIMSSAATSAWSAMAGYTLVSLSLMMSIASAMF